MPLVDFTAAAKDNFSLLAGDATACRKKTAELTSVVVIWVSLHYQIKSGHFVMWHREERMDVSDNVLNADR